ncbi:MAG: hypothetical protein UDM29_04160, partial [Dialister sp.]|nr:hypothetical protein [Dialister sp.]
PSYSGIRSSFAESAAVINQSLLWFVLDLESLCKLKKILFTQTILHSLCGASDFYALHHHSSLLTSN